MQSLTAIVVAVVATIRLLLCNFFPIFFSSRKKVNEPKENPPCWKTGFRREAHTRRTTAVGRPVVDINGPCLRSKKAHIRKLNEIISHALNKTLVDYTQYDAHVVKMILWLHKRDHSKILLYPLQKSWLKIIFIKLQIRFVYYLVFIFVHIYLTYI